MFDSDGNRADPGKDVELAEIIAIAPAVAWDQFKTQLSGPFDDRSGETFTHTGDPDA